MLFLNFNTIELEKPALCLRIVAGVGFTEISQAKITFKKS
jgi:hypothetical protein